MAIISGKDFEVIEKRPSMDVGRIPHKMHSGFASFTADQWKNWVNYYSLLCVSDFFLIWVTSRMLETFCVSQSIDWSPADVRYVIL